MKKRIVGAAAEEDSRLKDMMSNLKDDFDYIISGLETIDRMQSNVDDALNIANNLEIQFGEIISEIASKLSK